MSQYTQYPYSAEIKRNLFISRTQRRAKAALNLLILVALFGGLGAMLAWGGR